MRFPGLTARLEQTGAPSPQPQAQQLPQGSWPSSQLKEAGKPKAGSPLLTAFPRRPRPPHPAQGTPPNQSQSPSLPLPILTCLAELPVTLRMDADSNEAPPPQHQGLIKDQYP